jgi:hypothetical protein
MKIRISPLVETVPAPDALASLWLAAVITAAIVAATAAFFGAL